MGKDFSQSFLLSVNGWRARCRCFVWMSAAGVVDGVGHLSDIGGNICVYQIGLIYVISRMGWWDTSIRGWCSGSGHICWNFASYIPFPKQCSGQGIYTETNMDVNGIGSCSSSIPCDLYFHIGFEAIKNFAIYTNRNLAMRYPHPPFVKHTGTLLPRRLRESTQPVSS